MHTRMIKFQKIQPNLRYFAEIELLSASSGLFELPTVWA